MFATALALSQVTTHPESVKTEFDPVADQSTVVQLLQDGCAHMRKAFDVEDLNLDDLITTAMDDPHLKDGEVKAFRGINFDDLLIAYRQFCSKQPVENSPFDMKEVIEFYNKAAANLPDHTKLKGLKLPGTTVVLDGKNKKFAELFESDHRRIWVKLSEVPTFVQRAFVAAEDKRFYEHKGVDERGLIRAFISNLAEPGRPQGGSTITQQVAKNLLVGDDVSYERKIREMIVAVRLDRALTKDEILEVYLNSIYLGRGAWGIDMAADAYFKKPVSALSIPEAALLASLAKGPAYFNPDRFPVRVRERQAYVLKRMQEDGVITDDQWKQASATPLRFAVYERPRRETGFYFIDHVIREARTLVGMQSLTVDSYVVHSTINQDLQRATESALQEGLAQYEIATQRAKFGKPEMNLADLVQRIDNEQRTRAQRRDKIVKTVWQMALEAAHFPLYDVHWTPAIVLDRKHDDVAKNPVRVGIADGRILPLTSQKEADRAKLNLYDVVYVKVIEGKTRDDARAELRIRPRVQGAALVLENKTGRILAMAGGFSYVASQLNRTTQALRQPGSSIKPLVYLTALHKGLQPNTLILDTSITLPPITGTANARASDYWSPKNYEGGGSGVTTLRRAIERSRNMATAHLLEGALDKSPKTSLDMICDMAVQAHIYNECMKRYPFVLGAQALRMIDLAGFYAAIPNEGAYHQPHAIDSIELQGKTIYKYANKPVWLADGDRVAFYQLRTMLEGVISRGTATAVRELAQYAAGKTGTTDNENDSWFVSFTNDVTVAVWVGYDNASGRQTLGHSGTGGHLAAPIAQPIIEASWQFQAPKTLLNPPSAEAQKRMKAVPVNPAVGTHIATAKGDAYVEYLRTDSRGRVINTQNALVKGRYAEETEHARRPHRPLRRRAPERPFYFRSARR
jgi:membrane carboxypeptidase/penicillin-binding protein